MKQPKQTNVSRSLGIAEGFCIGEAGLIGLIHLGRGLDLAFKFRPSGPVSPLSPTGLMCLLTWLTML